MTTLFQKTDKAIIPTLPRYTFGGRIVVIQSEGEARRAVEYLRTFKLLGLDTETRPSFKRGIQHQVALLQIAGDGICFLFRLNFMGLPACLVELLEDPTILKIGLSLHDDFRALSHRAPELHPAGYVDLQHLSQGMGIEDLSLQKLWANFFHQRISKTAQLSNWEADHLDEKQRVYAATDADTVIHLYRRMSELHLSGDYTLIPPPPPPVPAEGETSADSQAPEAKADSVAVSSSDAAATSTDVAASSTPSADAPADAAPKAKGKARSKAKTGTKGKTKTDTQAKASSSQTTKSRSRKCKPSSSDAAKATASAASIPGSSAELSSTPSPQEHASKKARSSASSSPRRAPKARTTNSSPKDTTK